MPSSPPPIPEPAEPQLSSTPPTGAAESVVAEAILCAEVVAQEESVPAAVASVEVTVEATVMEPSSAPGDGSSSTPTAEAKDEPAKKKRPFKPACLRCKQHKVCCKKLNGPDQPCERCVAAGVPCVAAPPSRQGKRSKSHHPPPGCMMTHAGLMSPKSAHAFYMHNQYMQHPGSVPEFLALLGPGQQQAQGQAPPPPPAANPYAMYDAMCVAGATPPLVSAGAALAPPMPPQWPFLGMPPQPYATPQMAGQPQMQVGQEHAMEQVAGNTRARVCPRELPFAFWSLNPPPPAFHHSFSWYNCQQTFGK